MFSSRIENDAVLNILRTVKTQKGENIVSAGHIASLLIKKKTVTVIINTHNIFSADEQNTLQLSCTQALQKAKGIEEVNIIFTAESSNQGSGHSESQETKTSSSSIAMQKSCGTKNNNSSAPSPAATPKKPIQKINGVKHIIAVAAGKGGVGKSTIATNLAIALTQAGYRTGLVDADIYGPSIAHMMNNKEKPELVDGQFVPPICYDVPCISMGMLLDDDAPAIWRGPMITKALSQLLRQTRWENIDFLIIDLPPGTGDVQLSLCQNYPISAALMVSTPQAVSLLDVKKAVRMFEKLDIPLLGIVENMSYFLDPDTNKKSFIFGQGKVEEMANDLGLDVLTKIPLLPDIAKNADSGSPFAYENKKNPVTQSFTDLANRIYSKFIS